MSGLSEMLDGLKMLKEGITQYQVNSATQDAIGQLAEINKGITDKNERSIAAQQASQNLALRMVGAGASPGQVQAATEGLLPSASSIAQISGQERMQASGQTFQGQQNELNRESAERIAGIRAAAPREARLVQQEVKFLNDQQKAFDGQTKDSQKALNQIRLAKETLAAGNPIGDKSVMGFMARASGEVGALTEEDKRPFGGSQALNERMKQFAENAKTGKFTEDNRKLIHQLLTTYENVHKRNMQAAKSRVAKRAMAIAQTGKYNLTEEQVGNAIMPAEPNPNQAKIEAAKAILADPKNAQHPRRAELEAQIQKWESGQ